jgi:hypothetical protein
MLHSNYNLVPGRDKIGNIDIGGIPRFGPQTLQTSDSLKIFLALITTSCTAAGDI